MKIGACVGLLHACSYNSKKQFLLHVCQKKKVLRTGKKNNNKGLIINLTLYLNPSLKFLPHKLVCYKNPPTQPECRWK
jgi:hypothetical protein